jgi:hypothetical protein
MSDEPDKPDGKRRRLLPQIALTTAFCAFFYLSVMNDAPIRTLPRSVELPVRLVMLVGMPVAFWYLFLRPFGPR